MAHPAPVFNNQWEAIALHHWAGPYLETAGRDGRLLKTEVNEGIRISAIVKSLRSGDGRRDSRSRDAVAEILRLWDASKRNGPTAPRGEQAGVDSSPGSQMRSNGDGSISWIFPIEISVRAPLLTPAASSVSPAVTTVADPSFAHAERKRDEDENFSERGGYEPGFIHGFNIPLPDFSAVSYRIAKNLKSRAADDRFELRYHHFSIVMNAERRIAAFTACNIDGSRLKAVKST